MTSLAQLLTDHGSLLVLDASSTSVQVGLLRAGATPGWHTAAIEANRGLFAGAAECLAKAGRTLGDVGAFAFSEGPGSMLGARTAAMAIRTWQATDPRPRPAYRYQSLALVAHELVRRGTPAPFAVVADARRDSWHLVVVDAAGHAQPLRRVASAELAAFAGALWTPREFKSWSTPPRPFETCAYDVAALFAAAGDEDLFAATDAADAFQPEAPSYKSWSPAVHSAAGRATATP